MNSALNNNGGAPRPRRRAWLVDVHFETWAQKGLLAAIALWMLVAVALPLFQIFDRAVSVEIPIAIFGPDDIRLAGHRAHIENGKCFINGNKVDLADGRASADSVTISVSDGAFRVSASSAHIGGALREIPAVSAETKGDIYIIEGRALPADEWRANAKRFIGFSNFLSYLDNKNLRQSFFNSMKVSLASTVIAVLLAFVYAYGVTRAAMPFKPFFRLVAMLPIFAPTMLYGLSLVYLFGNKGILTTGLFGKLPWVSVSIPLYGPVGIVISEAIFAFPPAMMILAVALNGADARLYDAAAGLGMSRLKTFVHVTLPGIKYGLMSAVFVCFTLSFTDFGAPKVVGGNFNVLAVEIYKQVIGQHNFGMGATVSIVLLMPAMAAFAADRIIQRKQSAAMSSRSAPLTLKRSFWLDSAMFAACSAIAAVLFAMLFTAGFASLAKLWPYELSLGFWNYNFTDAGGGGYASFWNSVRVSSLTAAIGTPLAFVAAYLVEKTRGANLLRSSAYFLSILPLALPGLVIGIAYIFFFNKPSFSVPFIGLEIPNIFRPIYGTVAIIVLSNIVHFFTVSFLTATTALRQLDREFEAVSESLSVPFHKIFFRVTVPVCLPAIFEMTSYLFISSMATVSAVIFLYTPDTALAAVAVINMDDAGDTAKASAMCMLIVSANIVARFAFETLNYVVKKTTSAWRG